MSEPGAFTAAGITAFFITLLGPAAGQYAVIVFAALAGALWPLGAAETATRAQGVWLLLKLVLTSSVLTGAVAAYIESEYKYPVHATIAPVSFFIAAIGDKWMGVFDWVLEKIQSVIKSAPKDKRE